jgi:tight adherence protein C
MFTGLIFFLLTFMTIITLVWAGGEILRPPEDPLADRLAELQNAVRTSSIKRGAQIGRGFRPRFIRTIASLPGGAGWLKGSELRLRQAGYRGEEALGTYVAIAVTVVVACIAGMIWLERNAPASSIFSALIGAGIIGVIGPQFALGKMASRYRLRLQQALPDAVDLLGIVLGTGLALDQAMLRVSEELQYIYPGLANEFYTVVMQVRAGQERSKAFSAMARRTGIEDIKALSAMIIQSERFGTSLSQALKVYADGLRMRRRLRAETAVAKAGIKMLFPIIIFILPVLFVITLVPGMLTVLHNLELLGR